MSKDPSDIKHTFCFPEFANPVNPARLPEIVSPVLTLMNNMVVLASCICPQANCSRSAHGPGIEAHSGTQAFVYHTHLFLL